MLKVNTGHIKLLGESSSTTLLQNINFELAEGQIYSILGLNGAGKSTLVKSFTRLLDERFFDIHAQVQLFEDDIYTLQDDKLRDIRKEKIRYVFQDSVNSFDPLKSFQYYFELSEADNSSIDELLDYFLLPQREKLYKLHPYEISGGMAQRISIVLALLVKPSLLILDEPTSATDIPIANLIKLKLEEFIRNNSSSVLVITQDLKFASEISSHIAYLNQGKLSEFCKATDLFNDESEVDFQIFKNKMLGTNI